MYSMNNDAMIDNELEYIQCGLHIMMMNCIIRYTTALIIHSRVNTLSGFLFTKITFYN